MQLKVAWPGCARTGKKNYPQYLASLFLGTSTFRTMQVITANALTVVTSAACTICTSPMTPCTFNERLQTICSRTFYLANQPKFERQIEWHCQSEVVINSAALGVFVCAAGSSTQPAVEILWWVKAYSRIGAENVPGHCIFTPSSTAARACSTAGK